MYYFNISSVSILQYTWGLYVALFELVPFCTEVWCRVDCCAECRIQWYV